MNYAFNTIMSSEYAFSLTLFQINYSSLVVIVLSTLKNKKDQNNINKSRLHSERTGVGATAVRICDAPFYRFIVIIPRHDDVKSEFRPSDGIIKLCALRS